MVTPAAVRKMHQEQALCDLVSARAAAKAARSLEFFAASRARELELTYTEIGNAIGVTRQGAHRRYSEYADA